MFKKVFVFFWFVLLVVLSCLVLVVGGVVGVKIGDVGVAEARSGCCSGMGECVGAGVVMVSGCLWCVGNIIQSVGDWLI